MQPVDSAAGKAAVMEGVAGWQWFLVTLALSCVTILAVVFSSWELIEHRYFRDLDYTTLLYLYITRGVASSLLVAMCAAWFVLRERRRREAQLERAYEHYRTLLNNTPEAVVLFDENFRVLEWNHAPFMETEMQKQGPAWPRFRDEEMSDLLAFLRETCAGPRQEFDLLPADPERGWRLFQNKSCIACHAVRGERGEIEPELAALVEVPHESGFGTTT